MGMGGSCAIVCLVFTVESGGLFYVVENQLTYCEASL